MFLCSSGARSTPAKVPLSASESFCLTEEKVEKVTQREEMSNGEVHSGGQLPSWPRCCGEGRGFELLGLDVSLFIYVTFPSGMEPIESVWKIGEVKHWRLPDELSACHVQTDQSGLFLLELEASYWCVERFKPQMTAAVCLMQSFFNILMMRKCSIHANLFSNGHYIQLVVASSSSTTSSSSCSHFSLGCIT